MSKGYDAEDSQLYDGLEHVRKRPGMYVGGTGQDALHHLIQEIVNEAVKYAMIGVCSKIEIILRDNAVVQISDDTDGLSLEPISGPDHCYATAFMTNTNVYNDTLPYCVVGGMNGVGIAVINALCEWMSLEIRRDGFEWRQNYRQGVPISPFSINRMLNLDETMGNTFEFRPDFSIFERNEFDYERIAERCRAVAYSVRGLTIVLRDERDFQCREQVFWAKEGILSLLDDIRGDAIPFHDPIVVRHEYDYQPWRRREIFQVELELALQFTNREQPYIKGFINTLPTDMGGSHLDGFMKALHQYPKIRNLSKVFKQGMIAILNVRHPDPRFQSIVNPRVLNEDLEDAMFNLTSKALQQVSLIENRR